MLQSLLDLILSPKGLAATVSAVGIALGFLFGAGEVRRRRIALGIFHAYNIVEDIDRERGDTLLDKPAEGLKALNQWMLANGWRPLKPNEEQVARLGFTAIHGEQKAAVKAALAPVVAGLQSPPTPR